MQINRSFLLAKSSSLRVPCCRVPERRMKRLPRLTHPQPPRVRNATDLFPPGGGAPATPPTQTQTGTRSGGHRNGTGGHRQGRHHEMLVSQADSDPLTVRVAYRRAETIAMARDPGLADLIHQAAAASTDVDKRVFLKAYYVRLFASIRKIDPSPEMRSHVFLLSLIAEQRYDPKRREVGGDEDLVNGTGRGRRGRVE